MSALRLKTGSWSELMRGTTLTLTLALSQDGRGDWIPTYVGMTVMGIWRSHRV